MASEIYYRLKMSKTEYYLPYEGYPAFRPKTREWSGVYSLNALLQANALPDTEEGIAELNRRLESLHDERIQQWNENHAGTGI